MKMIFSVLLTVLFLLPMNSNPAHQDAANRLISLEPKNTNWETDWVFQYRQGPLDIVKTVHGKPIFLEPRPENIKVRHSTIQHSETQHTSLPVTETQVEGQATTRPIIFVSYEVTNTSGNTVPFPFTMPSPNVTKGTVDGRPILSTEIDLIGEAFDEKYIAQPGPSLPQGGAASFTLQPNAKRTYHLGIMSLQFEGSFVTYQRGGEQRQSVSATINNGEYSMITDGSSDYFLLPKKKTG